MHEQINNFYWTFVTIRFYTEIYVLLQIWNGFRVQKVRALKARAQPKGRRAKILKLSFLGPPRIDSMQ